jgi:phosphoketolase
VVIATVGDVVALEGCAAIDRCAVIGSTLTIRFVNIADLMRLHPRTQTFRTVWVAVIST